LHNGKENVYLHLAIQPAHHDEGFYSAKQINNNNRYTNNENQIESFIGNHLVTIVPDKLYKGIRA